MPEQIKAVIFDADGLMLDTERIGMIAWQQTGREYGYDITPEVHQMLLGLNQESSAEAMRAHFGQDFPYWELRDRRVEIGDEYMAQHGIPIKPGLLELLDFLEERGVPKAVATSTDRAFALKKLKLSGLGNRFSHIVAGDEVKNGKPAPDIFLAAAKLIGMEPPHCLVLEDSEPGVLGATAAGMLTVMVPDLKQPSQDIRQRAHRVFDSLHEVKDWLAEYWQ